MKLLKTAGAGTMESSDIQIILEPRDNGGIELMLQSSVMQQFGRQIEELIQKTLQENGVENALVTAVDKGALDCTIRARVCTAIYRAAEQENDTWEVKAE